MHVYVYQRSVATILDDDEASYPFMDVDGDLGMEMVEDETVIHNK